jgi:hypothetical protein
MRLAVILVLALAAAVSVWQQPPSAAAQPEIVLLFPEDGAVLAEAPLAMHMCFASPVNVNDLDKGGDFEFAVIMPDGRRLGLRIIFQPDGYGADVQPGLPEDPPEGTWTFEYRVTDAETLEPLEGTSTFTVVPDGSPLPEEEPSRCVGPGTPEPGATPTAAPDENGDDDDNTTVIAAIVAGAAGAAVLAGVVFVLLMRRGRKAS